MLYMTMLLVWARVQNCPHLAPSLAIMKGIEMRKERMVVRANWLPMLPRRSEMPAVDMSLAFSCPLKAAKRLARAAVKRADQAKSSSLTEARITPPMTGMRQSHCDRGRRLRCGWMRL